MITRLFVRESSPFVLAFLLLCPLFISLAFMPLARCRTLSVPSEDFPNIQSAVDNATDGETILISNGFYDENVVVWDKTLRFVATQPSECTIKGLSISNAENQIITALRLGYLSLRSSRGSRVSNNTISQLTLSGDNSIVEVNTIAQVIPGDYVGVSVGGNNLRVTQNWANACLSIQGSNCVIENNNATGIKILGHNNVLTRNVLSSGAVGITLDAGSVNNTVTNNAISSCSQTGILLWGFPSLERPVDGNTIMSNVITDCSDEYGYARAVELFNANNNNITSNTIENGTWVTISNSVNTLFSGNTISHNSQDGLQVGQRSQGTIVSGNTIIDNNGRGISLWDSEDSTISGNTIKNCNFSGVEIDESNNTIVSKNAISYNGAAGLYVWRRSDNTTVSDNVITNNGKGIISEESNRTAIFSNTIIDNNGRGIELSTSGNSNVSGNTISNNNEIAMHLVDCQDSVLEHNKAENNKGGIFLTIFNSYIASSGNDVTFNDLIDNRDNDGNVKNAFDECGATWDYNLYSDYAGVDADGDGIGDTPHPIPGGGMTDPHPRIYRANPTAELNLTCRLAKSFLTFGEAIEIEGNVTDESDNPVISAEVKLTIVFSNGTVLDPQSVTDAAGNFALNYAVQPTDPPGAWYLTIVASKSGVSGRFVTTVNIYGMRGVVYSRVHDANGVLTDRPFECNLTLMYPDGTKTRLTTDQMGIFDLGPYIVDGSGTVSPNVHTVFIENQENDASEYFSRWGTRNILPIHGLNREGPMLRAMFNGPLDALTTSVTLTADAWVKNATGSIVRVRSGSVDVQGGLLEIFVMTLEELEKLARWEVARLSKDAGVDITVPLETQIRYGVTKWFSSNWMGEYDPSNGEIRIEKSGDAVFSGIDKTPEQLTIWMHEMGHRVKDSRLHDPDADLGGPHDDEAEPGRNVEQVYDEGFACFFAALALDFSAELADSGHGYDNTAYYWGPVSQGYTGNWVEGRVAGIILSLYDIQSSWSTASREDALEDFFTKSDAFSFLMGRYPRTIDEWLYIKYALQPSLYSKLETLASHAQYNIEIFDCDLLLDNTGAAKRENSEGVLRFSDSEYVAFTTSELNLQLESPSNLDPPGESNTLAGRIAVLPLKRDNLTTTSSDPTVVWVKKVSASDPNWPFVGWLSIQMKNPSELRFTPSANELEINGVGEVFLNSHYKSPQTAQFTIKFSGTTVTLNSEVLIKLGNDGGIEITVFRGHVEVSGDYWTREIAPEGTVAADGAGSMLSEGKAELTAIERWWIDLIPKPYVVDHVLCKEVTQDGAPVEETSTFAAEDQVYHSLNLVNVSAGDLVRWIFRGPNGIVSEASWISNSSGNDYFWNMLDLKDYDSADAVGNWTVSVYMSEEETVTDEFTVQPQSNLNAWAIIMTIVTRTDFLIAAALSSIALVTLIILVSRRKPKR